MSIPARRPKPTTPRRFPKSRIGALTVDAILGAVERILEQDGPDRLTTNRVAELAGVSIGSLYQYFPNKEALIGALQDRYAEDTLSRVRAAFASAENLPIETLVLRVGIALFAAKQGQWPIHRWLIDWRPAVRGADRYRGRLDAEVTLVAEFLARRGDLAFADPASTAFVLVHAIEGVIEAVSERPSIEALEIARVAIGMVTAFIRYSTNSSTSSKPNVPAPAASAISEM